MYGFLERHAPDILEAAKIGPDNQVAAAAIKAANSVIQHVLQLAYEDPVVAAAYLETFIVAGQHVTQQDANTFENHVFDEADDPADEDYVPDGDNNDANADREHHDDNDDDDNGNNNNNNHNHNNSHNNDDNYDHLGDEPGFESFKTLRQFAKNPKKNSKYISIRKEVMETKVSIESLRDTTVLIDEIKPAYPSDQLDASMLAGYIVLLLQKSDAGCLRLNQEFFRAGYWFKKFKHDFFIRQHNKLTELNLFESVEEEYRKQGKIYTESEKKKIEMAYRYYCLCCVAPTAILLPQRSAFMKKHVKNENAVADAAAGFKLFATVYGAEFGQEPM